MKRIFLVTMAVLMALMLIACNATEAEPSPTPAPTEVPTATPEPTPVPTPTPSPTPEPTPTPDPFTSNTTGLHFEGAYRPVIVSIENSSAARPQLGLQTADVVYEMAIAGSTTRFLCVFSDNVPEEVMPVRSARIPFLYIVNEWDAAFVHHGGSGSNPNQYNTPYSVYGHELYDDIKIDIDALKGKWAEYFFRSSKKSAPHNSVCKLQMVPELYDYEPEPMGWLFSSDAVYTGESVTEISLSMNSNDDNFVSYTYDAANNVYLRFMDGKKFLSDETDAQISVRNIIVQYSTYKIVEGITMWEMLGSGNADFYIGGKLMHGTWKRETVSDKTVFYDAAGSQIVLTPGNTWIHLSPEK